MRMSRYVFVGIMGMVLIGMPVYADMISDVSPKDSAYSAISRSVKEGYLPLYTNDIFQPEQPVSRREMAVIIERLLSDSDQQTVNFSKTDIQELKTLLKAFKTYMSEYDTASKLNRLSLSKLETEQKVLNTDVTKLTDQTGQKLDAMKKEQQEQTFLMWIAIGAAAFLGMVVH